MITRINKNPSNKELREFAWVVLIGFGLLGGLLFWKQRFVFAYSLWGTVSAIWLLSRTRLINMTRPFYVAWMGFAFIMGSVMSRVLMTFIFFFLVTPIALVFKFQRRDALKVKPHRESPSYWLDHPRIDDPASYKHLF